MAVKETKYRYFPSQERLVNVSNYIINPEQASSRPDGLPGSSISMQPNAGGFPHGANRTLVDGMETSADFEMKNVRWSEKTSTVSDLLTLKFPVIVRVVKGYYGNDGQQLTDGQILQIYSSYEQLRVAATDSKDRTLTLPINCPLSVRFLSGSHSSGHAQTLSELLEDVSLPANIEVIGVNRKNSLSTSSLSDSHLTLREISRQNFLVANAITKGWLDQTKFVVIPEQLKLTFQVATGIREATVEEWKDVCGMYSRAARHLMFHLICGHEDAIYDDWINQTNPSTVERSLRIDYDGEEEEEEEEEEAKDNESDSDSSPMKNRCRLLWQQAPLTQGSLPSLPVALRNCSTDSDPRPESMASGSVTPSHLSTESLQPCISTESLLPRSSIDCVTVVKEPVGKRKSNVPSRLLRRKAEPKKQATGSATVQATEFELKPRITEARNVSQTRGLVPSSASTSRPTAPVSRLSEHGDKRNVDNAFDSVFDDPSWKDIVASSTESLDHRKSSIQFGRDSSLGQQGQRTPDNPQNASLNDVTSASLNDVTSASLDDDRKKWPMSDCSSHLRGSSDDALFDFRSADGHVRSPVYWSSDLCIASSSELEIARTKRKKSQTRSAILPRDFATYQNATTDRPPSPNCHSTPLQVPSRMQSFGFHDSTRSLFNSTPAELPARHTKPPGYDSVPQGPLNISPNEYGGPRVHPRRLSCEYHQFADPGAELRTSNSSTDCNLANGADCSNPIRLGVSRSRKLSNGLVKMRLDQNGTVVSSGSDVVDDGYSTKGNSMTSSLEMLTARRSLKSGRDSSYFI